MFIFGLFSTSDDQLSDLSKKMLTEMQKMKKAPKVIEKSNVHSFLDYVQLLMIG